MPFIQCYRDRQFGSIDAVDSVLHRQFSSIDAIDSVLQRQFGSIDFVDSVLQRQTVQFYRCRRFSVTETDTSAV